MNAAAVNYRLQCGSPCVDAIAIVFQPVLDLVQNTEDNENGNATEKTPNRDLKTRVVAALDMGAYEKQPNPCAGDVNHSGVVNVDDLLAVINAWGACAAPCPAD